MFSSVHFFRREPSKLSIDRISVALFHWTNYGSYVNKPRDLDELRDLDEIDFFRSWGFPGAFLYRNGPEWT